MSIVRFIIFRGHAALYKTVAAPLDVSKRRALSSCPAFNLVARAMVFMYLHRQLRCSHVSCLLETTCYFCHGSVTVLQTSGVQVCVYACKCFACSSDYGPSSMDRAECLATSAVLPPLSLSLSVPYLSIHLYPSTFSSSIEIDTDNPVPE